MSYVHKQTAILRFRGIFFLGGPKDQFRDGGYMVPHGEKSPANKKVKDQGEI